MGSAFGCEGLDRPIRQLLCGLDPLSIFPGWSIGIRGICCAPRCTFWTEHMFQKTFVMEKKANGHMRWYMKENKSMSPYCCGCINPCKIEICETRRLATDIFICLRNIICLPCFHVTPMRNIFLAGRKASGKTTLMKMMMVGSLSLGGKDRGGDDDDHDIDAFENRDEKDLFLPKETFGLHNEQITFNVWQVFEVYDVGGSLVQNREMWRSVYRTVEFDTVLYTLDVSQFVSTSDPVSLSEDRDEIHKLLAEADLRDSDFFIFLIFKSVDVDDDNKTKYVEEVREALELDKFKAKKRVQIFSELMLLVTELNVDGKITPGLCSEIV